MSRNREQRLMVVAVGMVVFVVSLFLDWAGIDTPLGDSGSNGTEPNSWWVAAAFALIAALIAVAEAVNYPAPFRWMGVGLCALSAALVFFWAVTRFVDATEGPLSPQLGAWIGVIASGVSALLAGLLWDRERT